MAIQATNIDGMYGAYLVGGPDCSDRKSRVQALDVVPEASGHAFRIVLPANLDTNSRMVIVAMHNGATSTR